MMCRVCGELDENKPQIFRGEPWCCDKHRKVITGEVPPTAQEMITMDSSLLAELKRKADAKW